MPVFLSVCSAAASVAYLFAGRLGALRRAPLGSPRQARAVLEHPAVRSAVLSHTGRRESRSLPSEVTRLLPVLFSAFISPSFLYGALLPGYSLTVHYFDSTGDVTHRSYVTLPRFGRHQNVGLPDDKETSLITGIKYQVEFHSHAGWCNTVGRIPMKLSRCMAHYLAGQVVALNIHSIPEPIRHRKYFIPLKFSFKAPPLCLRLLKKILGQFWIRRCGTSTTICFLIEDTLGIIDRSQLMNFQKFLLVPRKTYPTCSRHRRVTVMDINQTWLQCDLSLILLVSIVLVWLSTVFQVQVALVQSRAVKLVQWRFTVVVYGTSLVEMQGPQVSMESMEICYSGIV